MPDTSLARPMAAAPTLMKLLAHDVRWQALEVLVCSDHRVHELVELLGQPFNLVSYHLRRLREARLVTERRSTADGRDIYYSLELDRLRELYFAAGESLHPALSNNGVGELIGTLAGETQEEAPQLPPVRVLFLCTHNRARSQMAEAIMRHLGGSMVEVFSAGTIPSEIHPLAVRALRSLHIDVGAGVSAQRSKHVDEYRDQRFDYVITLCDRAREVCPVLPGDPEQRHWSFPDPAAVSGSEEQQFNAFLRTVHELQTRIRYLLLLIEKDRKEQARRSI